MLPSVEEVVQYPDNRLVGIVVKRHQVAHVTAVRNTVFPERQQKIAAGIAVGRGSLRRFVYQLYRSFYVHNAVEQKAVRENSVPVAGFNIGSLLDQHLRRFAYPA